MQQQTNQLFRFYRQFFRVFINNIIIFFYSLKKYLLYLKQIFKFFRVKRVSLILTKSFLNYFLIILLNQRVDNLDLLTLTKKIVAITSLRFLKNLKNLNYFLNFIK